MTDTQLVPGAPSLFPLPLASLVPVLSSGLCQAWPLGVAQSSGKQAYGMAGHDSTHLFALCEPLCAEGDMETRRGAHSLLLKITQFGTYEGGI